MPVTRLLAWFGAVVLLLLAGFYLVFAPPHYPPASSVAPSGLDKLVESSCTIRSIPLAESYDGPARATLISGPRPEPCRGQVLYVHGFGDYFFQHHVLQWFAERGFAFHALELRRYGRSWLPHQRPNYTRDLGEYFEELDSAIARLAHWGPEPILLMGHSTGGLTTSLYLASGDRANEVDALILNSPFLDFNAGVGTEAIIGLLSPLWRLSPYGAVPGADTSRYTQSLHVDYAGRWDFNTRWKPVRSFPVFLSWLRAVGAGHRQVAEGLDLSVPVLLLHADRSIYEDLPPEELQRGDAVLDVKDMRRLAPKLAPDLRRVEVPGALHDVFLSEPAALEAAFRQTEQWLDERFSN